MSMPLNLVTINVALSAIGHPSSPPAQSSRPQMSARNGPIFTAVGRAWRQYMIHRACRATRIILKGLDKRGLSDIGVRRDEIDLLVARLESELTGSATRPR